MTTPMLDAAVEQARTDARKMYRTLEPLHAFIYFDAGAVERYTAAGLKGGHMQYFASRAAAMGAVGPGPVAATFFNFNPTVVERALPSAWAFAPVDAVLAARHDAAADTYAKVFEDPADVAQALELLGPAVEVVRPLMAGRPLAAAHADLPVPTEPLRQLWWRITVLREWRGDGHVAALTVDGMDPVEVLHTHIAAGGVNGDILRLTRAWPEDRWAAAGRALADRGELDASGALTATGAARRQAVEDHTDALAAAPWLELGPERCGRLRTLLRPYAGKILAASGLDAMIKN
jgi:hypothetical protein